MDCTFESIVEIKQLLKVLVEQTSALREEIEEIKGYGICNNISDICDKLDNIECAIAEGSSL